MCQLLSILHVEIYSINMQPKMSSKNVCENEQDCMVQSALSTHMDLYKLFLQSNLKPVCCLSLNVAGCGCGFLSDLDIFYFYDVGF